MKKLIIVIVMIVIVASIVWGIKVYYLPQRASVKIPILLYHNFVEMVPESDPDGFQYINTKESFEENLKVLLANGYTPISFLELNNAYQGKSTLPLKPIIITFDDGYASNYELVFPIIQKYQIKASIFIVTDFIDKEINGISYLSWQECLEMQNSGLIEIYSHSKRHIFYNKVPVRSLRDDVLESYQIIEENLGKKDLKVFAYPYGAYTVQSVKALKNNGMDMQIYDIGLNDFKDLDKHYLKRINIPCEMTGQEIMDMIEN